MLSVGIIGLPNVGKSTLFNALTAAAAEVSNYPFTTIEPNVGVVAVPDPRLHKLATVLEPAKTTPSCIRFVDIAGLVEGASRGEGLGNQFLGEIRQVDAVAHVLRCFDDTDVAHVYAEVDPTRDAAVVDTELMLADLEVLTRAMAKRDREWRTHPQDHAAEKLRFERYRESLEAGRPLRGLDLTPGDHRELKGVGMLTGKPLLLVANTQDPDDRSEPVERLAGCTSAAAVVTVAAKLEWELQQLDEVERREFMDELEMAETGLDRLVRVAFELLGLIRFYTVAKGKLQAWAIPRGTRAPQAAGEVHTDMERGFIRAHVAGFDEVCAHGGWSALRAAGALRTVGRDHQVADGDVVEFLFNA